ncbi:Rho guanine nucleotide exchange factor [Marasmius crinis-equi]|uniref:Rho guanine nucleotide exchange factor n=1 Tax=Marasmius crinis-equi TaxID=585013 RepID=A0ABR3EY81_9AGAR
MTSTTRSPGTGRWLAPELLVENGKTSKASDIYAFGCVCYEIFTGKHPFPELPTDAAVVVAVNQGKRPSRPKDISELTDIMWALIEACWHRTPSSRPEAAQVLDQILKMSSRKTTSPAPDWNESLFTQVWANVEYRSLVTQTPRNTQSENEALNASPRVEASTSGNNQSTYYGSPSPHTSLLHVNRNARTDTIPVFSAAVVPRQSHNPKSSRTPTAVQAGSQSSPSQTSQVQKEIFHDDRSSPSPHLKNGDRTGWPRKSTELDHPHPRRTSGSDDTTPTQLARPGMVLDPPHAIINTIIPNVLGSSSDLAVGKAKKGKEKKAVGWLSKWAGKGNDRAEQKDGDLYQVEKDTGFRGLWKRIKAPQDKPVMITPFVIDSATDGAPVFGLVHHHSESGSDVVSGQAEVFGDPEDTQLNSASDIGTLATRGIDAQRSRSASSSSSSSSIGGTTPIGEDIQRMFREGFDGWEKATTLRQALLYASPEDFVSHSDADKSEAGPSWAQCVASQRLIAGRIPLASALAKSSERNAGVKVDETPEQRLLDVLLATNEELMATLEQYEGLERSARLGRENFDVALGQYKALEKFAQSRRQALGAQGTRSASPSPLRRTIPVEEDQGRERRNSDHDLTLQGPNRERNADYRHRDFHVEQDRDPFPELEIHRDATTGLIAPDEEIRRLFQVCIVGQGNASLLSQALVHMLPEEFFQELSVEGERGTGGYDIKEFKSRCIGSQEFIARQIPWASAGAERSRREAGHGLEETTEERLLGNLLAANEGLLTALAKYKDLEKAAVPWKINEARHGGAGRGPLPTTQRSDNTDGGCKIDGEMDPTSPGSDLTPCRALARCSYIPSSNDSDHISFEHNEVIDILDREGDLWPARKADGTFGREFLLFTVYTSLNHTVEPRSCTIKVS